MCIKGAAVPPNNAHTVQWLMFRQYHVHKGKHFRTGVTFSACAGLHFSSQTTEKLSIKPILRLLDSPQIALCPCDNFLRVS